MAATHEAKGSCTRTQFQRLQRGVSLEGLGEMVDAFVCNHFAACEAWADGQVKLSGMPWRRRIMLLFVLWVLVKFEVRSHVGI